MKAFVRAGMFATLLGSSCACAQSAPLELASAAGNWMKPPEALPETLGAGVGGSFAAASGAEELPDSPGAVELQQHGIASLRWKIRRHSAGKQAATPCPAAANVSYSDPEATSAAVARTPCVAHEDPYRRFLNSTAPLPLTVRQKGILAFRDVVDPFNLLTVVGNAGVTVAADSHTAYGPGWKGFGRDSGYSLVEDATGEFVGTFLLCSVFHQDPHYHRMPDARPMRRVLHAFARTVVAQNDYGKTMVNYENLIGSPASAEISNLYVPGIHGNGPSTVARVLTGLATDPANNLITEFLPDVAKRVHVRVVFVQQIINEVATGQEQL